MDSGSSGPTPEQVRADQRREREYAELDRVEAKKMEAAKRKRRGRASLISGAETGIQETLG